MENPVVYVSHNSVISFSVWRFKVHFLPFWILIKPTFTTSASCFLTISSPGFCGKQSFLRSPKCCLKARWHLSSSSWAACLRASYLCSQASLTQSYKRRWLSYPGATLGSLSSPSAAKEKTNTKKLLWFQLRVFSRQTSIPRVDPVGLCVKLNVVG